MQLLADGTVGATGSFAFVFALLLVLLCDGIDDGAVKSLHAYDTVSCDTTQPSTLTVKLRV